MMYRSARCRWTRLARAFPLSAIGGVAVATGLFSAASARAQTVTPTTLYSFGTTSSDGANPYSTLVADSSGNLYGTTASGGADGDGTIFELANLGSDHYGAATILYSFTDSGVDGANPYAGLSLDSNGDLFGATYYGGANGDGSVFELAKSGSAYSATATTLYSFSGFADGYGPNGGVTLDSNGDIFGTTSSSGPGGAGTVFEIKNNGASYSATAATLASFTGTGSVGSTPNSTLAIDSSGNLIGTTTYGGTGGSGTVFEIANTGGGTFSNSVSTLYSFTGTGSDGSNPESGVTIDAEGNLIGTTLNGGSSGEGTVYELAKSGGAYSSAATTVYSFSGSGSDGASPYAPLTINAAGNLIGATENGGANGEGTVFEIAGVDGSYGNTASILYSFTGDSSDGAQPVGGVLVDSDGNLLGTTRDGGDNFGGTVYELTFSDSASAPEPCTLALLPIGACLALARRRRHEG